MTDLDTGAFESRMWTAVSAVDDARAKLDAAQAALDAAREAAAAEMQRYGSALTISGEVVPTRVVRSLYWEHLDIHVSAIAKAFAIKGGAGAVHAHAGDDFFDAPCPAGCGRTVRLTARTAPLRPCPSCAEQHQAQREQEWAQWREENARRIAERDEWAKQQLRDGRTSDELYVELVARWETNGPLPHLRDLEAAVQLEAQGDNPF